MNQIDKPSPKVSTSPQENRFSDLISASQWQEIGRCLQLTTREIQVCQLIFQAKTRNQIADSLELKARSIRHYMERIHFKLSVNNRVSLVLVIIQTRDELIRQEAKKLESVVST